MPSPQETAFADQAIATMDALERESMAGWPVHPPEEVHIGPDLIRLITGFPIPFFNTVAQARFAPDDADAAIATTLDRFRARAVPMLWYVGPGSAPPDLGERLVAHGLTPTDDSPAMARELGAMPPDDDLPPGLRVARVADPATFARFGDIVGAGFGIPPEVAAKLVEIFGRVGFGPEQPWRHDLGCLDGEPVAAASRYLSEDAVGIFNVVTREDVRGRGIGAAMTRVILHEAAAGGRRLAVLTSSPDGEPLYRKLGFVEIGRVRTYLGPG
ncbi:MAG: hypothetical protein AVDCRST_MAG73-1489 [uncultured Thermomicrobiales bacterium]|uniref:N-acetyltransferase domain-containing protein n=1 Tax=uncultured Thermomicrobiales bacterium TaxID=1645740 RepID=A0A6J4U213_9BACT|nr:MAG: hypothetical protein AVDCRST_MAG73-1489 [uncultured Thermomicrobiales bacterium]